MGRDRGLPGQPSDSASSRAERHWVPSMSLSKKNKSRANTVTGKVDSGENCKERHFPELSEKVKYPHVTDLKKNNKQIKGKQSEVIIKAEKRVMILSRK